MKRFTNIMPLEVETIISIIESCNEEAYIVGGCVRDFLLGKTPKDYDITTSMTPDAVSKLFKEKEYTVVPTGLKHGTVTVIPKNGTEGYEITTYRTDGEYLDGRHPSSVSFTKSLEEDLSRRDLTINAMAYSHKHGLVDLYGGQSDLNNKIIRTVGNPEDRIKEDALRMMRAIRFSAQLKFDIAEDLVTAIKKNNASINLVSKERIHDELVKTLMSDNPEYVRKYYETGLMKHFLPELHICFLTKQNNPWHLYNVGDHIMKALSATEKNLILRLTILLHDIGKPDTKVTDELGIDHFYGHAEKSEIRTKEVLKRLKFTSKEIEDVSLLVLIHDYRVDLSKKAIRRFVSKYNLDDRLFELYIKTRQADYKGQNLELSENEIKTLDVIVEKYEEIKNQPLSVKDLAVTGYDVMSFGYVGVQVGEVLEKLLQIVLDNPEKNTKDELLFEIKNL